MTLADRTAGKFLLDLSEVDVESCLDRVEVGVESGAHLFDLGVGLCLHVGKLLCLLAFEDHRIGKTLAAEVGSARVVRVIDPQAGCLVLAVERDEFDVEKREKIPRCALFLPFAVAVEAVEIVDSDHSDLLGRSHVKSLLHAGEGAEGVRGVHVGIYIDDVLHCCCLLSVVYDLAIS